MKQYQVISDFIEAIKSQNKSVLAKYAGIKTFDTAFPQERADSIRQVYPEWRGSWQVYSYDESVIWGEFAHVGEKAILKFIELFNECTEE